MNFKITVSNGNQFAETTKALSNKDVIGVFAPIVNEKQVKVMFKVDSNLTMSQLVSRYNKIIMTACKEDKYIILNHVNEIFLKTMYLRVVRGKQVPKVIIPNINMYKKSHINLLRQVERE